MRSAAFAIAIVALALGLSACAGDQAQETTTAAPPPSETMGRQMSMGDPDATSAAQVAGAQLSTGEFVALPTAPAGTTPNGEAALARHDAGTTVTLHLRGLDPGTAFIAHVHEGACHEAGGIHYKHDPQGGDMPPNEIHLSITSDSAGMATMTVENPQVADGRARSVVVHLAAADAPKLACADLDDVG